jgi:hypothetical protein
VVGEANTGPAARGVWGRSTEPVRIEGRRPELPAAPGLVLDAHQGVTAREDRG